MKFVSLPSGFNTLISNEESLLLDQISQTGQVSRSELNEREQVVANNLVKKDVLTRRKIDGKLYYSTANMQDIWRI